MLIRELFSADVTRAIPPVVYFHEQGAAKLAEEVGEYIITGGYPREDPRFKRVPDGIHDQFLRLLKELDRELRRPGGPELPAVWISGFYGSGKSSLAKLLGLALDGRTLPDGTPLARALLARDQSPGRAELAAAWDRVRSVIDPLAVVFDIGAVARDGEHIHAAALRQLQNRLGYCAISASVAETELKLETDGRWTAFLETAARALGRPWDSARTEAMAEDHFSHVMHALEPTKYLEPLSWLDSRIGDTRNRGLSVDEVVRACETMLRHRAPGKTLFLVVDEVSQYVHQDEDRMLKLQTFVSALGQRLKGGAWLLATGQKRLEDTGGDPIGKLKDRFPPHLRVHLSAANIRDVVHRRLLQKTDQAAERLAALFEQHRAKLKLHGYGCQDITTEDFVEVYPLLPGHVELLMQITTALRAHSSRAQSDTHAIRGLLQLLGELFRTRKLAEAEVGELVTLDAIYEVQATSLEADTQSTLVQLLNHEAVTTRAPLAPRVVRAVALLERIQERTPTTDALVAQCLYTRLGQDGIQREVADTLQALKDANCLSYTEKLGYKLQSSSGQEWVRERDDLSAPDATIHDVVKSKLKSLMDTARPQWKGRAFPWVVTYSDRYGANLRLSSGRDETAVTVDFQFVTEREQRKIADWVRRSDEGELHDRLVWVAGEIGDFKSLARDLVKSRAMFQRYGDKRAGLPGAKQRLLIEEEARRDELETRVERAVAAVFMAGRLYFRGKDIDPTSHGAGFTEAVRRLAERYLPDLYPYFSEEVVGEKDWPQLLERDLASASNKFYEGGLGILSIDGGRSVATCSGVVPSRILKCVEDGNGASGNLLIQTFARPPYGYPVDVIRACLAGLLRASKVRIQPEGGGHPLTSHLDKGCRDLFTTDRALRMAEYLPAKVGEITQRDLNAIRRLFQGRLGVDVDPERETLADAGFRVLTDKRAELRLLEGRLERLPGRPPAPRELVELAKAVDACLADRYIDPIIKALKANLDRLNDGLEKLGVWRVEVTDDAVDAVTKLARCRDTQLAQLVQTADGLDTESAADGDTLATQLASPTPWRAIQAAEAAAERLTERYRLVRRALLATQTRDTEEARAQVRTRKDFERLTAEECHEVLRPLAGAPFDTTEDAIAPSLAELTAQFPPRLVKAKAEADERLNDILDKKFRTPVRTIRLPIHGREVESRAQLRAVLDEIETQLGPLVDHGVRVRIQ